MTDQRETAARLLRVDAVKLNPGNPFTWASGWKSPIYCDNRRLLSYPMERDFIKSEMCRFAFEQYPDIDAIAGVATAGIAWGAMIADQLKLPFMYVRPAPKQHGMGNQIEGAWQSGHKVLVIEDLISTGKSSLGVCEVLQKEGMIVAGMLAIFNYGFPHAAEAFAKAGISFQSLTNYQDLVDQAVEQGIIRTDQVNSLLNWRANPSEWTGNE